MNITFDDIKNSLFILLDCKNIICKIKTIIKYKMFLRKLSKAGRKGAKATKRFKKLIGIRMI